MIQYTTVPPKMKGVSVTMLKTETKSVNKQTGLGNILPRGKPCQRNPQPGSQLPLTLFGGQLLFLILGVVYANKGSPPPPTRSLPVSFRGNCTRKFKLYTPTFCLETFPMSKYSLFLLPTLKLSKTDISKAKKKKKKH